jgi:AbrB family looped-hinge helix DNA binding protein
MPNTTLSSKGQVVIPKTIRDRFKLRTGQALDVIATNQGILLLPKTPADPTTPEQVAGMLKYEGKPLSLAEMEAGIITGVRKRQK